MQPIFNIIDNGKSLKIEFKDGTIGDSKKIGWKSFYVKKQDIKKDYPNEFADLDFIF